MTVAVRLTDEMISTVPDGRSGTVEVARYQVSEHGALFARIRAARDLGRGATIRAGATYTGLYRHGALWMSDTPDERRDMITFVSWCRTWEVRRVLVNGLGLGMVLQPLINTDSVRHIDVVECDPDVIALVAPHMQARAAEAGKTLDVHLGDAYSYRFPAGTSWDCAWHDIWKNLSTDNLRLIARLHRRYGGRTRFQMSWCHDLLRAQRDRERRRGW